jgi:biotin transport system substrate-specific component
MNANLLSTVWPKSQLLHKAALVGLGVVLLAISSKVQVPFWPVPMTLQTLVVLMIGATSGARLAGATLVSYLAAGAVGLPVFASGVGLAYMVGPTGGYLAGFLVAAVVIGYLADKGYGRSILSALALFAIGEVAIFALGTGWLACCSERRRRLPVASCPSFPAKS